MQDGIYQPTHGKPHSGTEPIVFRHPADRPAQAGKTTMLRKLAEKEEFRRGAGGFIIHSAFADPESFYKTSMRAVPESMRNFFFRRKTGIYQ